MLSAIIMDDEYFFRTSIKNTVPWSDYHIELIGEANNGKAGLELILNLRPDIAIVDINMPHLDGLSIIREAQKHGCSCEFILLTGYSEFTYAKEAISLNVDEYILKPVDMEELRNALDKLSSKIMDNKRSQYSVMEHLLLLDLISPNFGMSEHELAIYIEDIRSTLSFNYKFYCVLSIAFDNLKPFELSNLISLIKQKDFPVSMIPFTDASNNLCIITDYINETVFSNFIAYLKEFFKENHLSYYIGVGNNYPTIMDLFSSYTESTLALKNKLTDHQHIVFYCNCQSALEGSYVNTRLKEKLTQHILNKNIIEVKGLIRDFFRYAKESQLSYNMLIMDIFAYINTLVSTLQQSRITTCHIIEKDIITILNKFTTLEQYENWLTHIFEHDLHNMQKQPDSNDCIAIRIEQYIYEHIGDTSLSISSISKALYMHYSYICFCFKRDRHMTINEFLIHIRMRKAKNLFIDGLTNVTYVSKKVGYDNPSYFSKVFKKMYGISPSLYIQKIEQT